MDSVSLPLSPPCDVDDRLFPDLETPAKLLNTPTVLQKLATPTCNFDQLPNIIVGDDLDFQMLRSSYLNQNQSKVSSTSFSKDFHINENDQPLSPSSSHSSEGSANAETVVVTADAKGRERQYRGPNRNAIMAKLNRERKKKQLSQLEGNVSALTDENEELRRDKTELEGRVHGLEAEVDYLKGVLANQSELSGLLNNIRATSLSFHSSIPPPTPGNKRATRPITDAPMSAKRSRQTKLLKAKRPVVIENITLGRANKAGSIPVRSALFEDGQREKDAIPLEPKGVCLHVKNRKVSLEFCATCSTRAEAAFKQDQEAGS